MNNEYVVQILNELFAAESGSVLARLREVACFVSWSSAHEKRVLDRLVAEEREHCAWLVQAITDLGGVPWSVGPDIASTNLHFLELSYLLPRIIDDRQKLLEAYESAATKVGAHPVAGPLIDRILSRQRRHVQGLSELHQRVGAAPA